MTYPIDRIGVASPLKPVAALGTPVVRPESSGPSFAETLKQALDTTNALQVEAGQQAEMLAAGIVDDAHSVTIAAERASLALQLTVAVRNKALEAYQEVMRMQV